MALTLLAIASLPIAHFLKKLLWPTFDAREPPIIRPRIPAIGHLIALATEKSGFYRRLYKENTLPICTLPMLSGKLYVINSPGLVSAAMKNKDLSFDPFSLEFSSGAMGLTKEHIRLYSKPGTIEKIYNVIHMSLTGENLGKMTIVGLDEISLILNAIPTDESRIPNSLEWFRRPMFNTVMKCLYGEKNPFGEEEMQCLLEYDKGIALLGLNIAPSLVAPKAFAAREKLKDTANLFYMAEHYNNSDVSALIRNRVKLMLEFGFEKEDLAVIEFILCWVSSTNTIPTLFWLFTSVFSSPERLQRVREEVESAVVITGSGSDRTATISIAKLRSQCPLFIACFQETHRVYNDSTGNRRVMEDVILKDPAEGRDYLLTKGTNVQWISSVLQTDKAVWGSEAEQFDPTKWLTMQPQDNRPRKSMIPFGGGKNLCPGRIFAEAELLGYVSGLVLAFEVEGVQVPQALDPYPGGSVKIPSFGDADPGCKMRRRPNWENVTIKLAL
ncbi:cytochrome P450 [Mariannaea sp. PMI_226]|nr:cytochrome P450 [Mariannaea sp. PMI_226]